MESLNLRRCYDCFRPRADCFCADIPTIDTRTELLIVQHHCERNHPFNTARIVHRSLKNSRLLVGHVEQLATELRVRPRAGVLYPGPGSVLLSELPREQHPEQLVVLDGTWHHTKTMMRDIPALRALPRYRLAPTSPSRYGIRREPHALFISTVEAVIAALQVLEPGTHGLDRLMDVFLAMVRRQLSFSKSADGARTRLRPKRTFKNIPVSLVGDMSQVVAAYGESASREIGNERAPRLPLCWVAQRLGTGELFRCLIQPQQPLTDALLGHLELTRDDFAQATTLEEARAAWQTFLRPGETVAVYNGAVSGLAAQLQTAAAPCLVLRSVDLNANQSYRTLEELIAAEHIPVVAAQQPGRAGKRLANLVAFVRHLHALGSACTQLVADETLPHRMPASA